MAVTCSCWAMPSFVPLIITAYREGWGTMLKTQEIGNMIDNNRQVECKFCASRLYVLVLVMSLLVSLLVLLLLLLLSSPTFV